MKAWIRYSEAFKRRVVEELESGRHRSIEAARRTYGIGGSMTVPRWVRRYGHDEFFPKRVRIETLKERDELKDARQRIRELEAAIADAHVDYCLEKGFLQVACDRLGEDLDDFKKKNDMTLSATRRPRKKRKG